MKKQTAMWTTQDGTKVRICDMTASHLANAIRFLERAATSAALAPNPFRGDIAEYMFDCEQDAAIEEGVDVAEEYPIYEKLCAERDRRAQETRKPR